MRIINCFILFIIFYSASASLSLSREPTYFELDNQCRGLSGPAADRACKLRDLHPGETIYVKYFKRINLKNFTCGVVNDRDLRRKCHVQFVDNTSGFAVVQLRGVWYGYCDVDLSDYFELTSYQKYIDSWRGGPFDCRIHGWPNILDN